MPKSFLYRIDSSVPPTKGISSGTFIPYNTVLFSYSNDWDSNSPADPEVKKYYRKFTEIISDTGVMIKEDGTPVKNYKVNPFIYSSNSELNWESNTALILAPNNDIKLYDNLLGGSEKQLSDDISTNYSGRHGYTTGANPDAAKPSRSPQDLPKVLGRLPDEEASTEKYVIHDRPHTGHQHFVSGKDISKAIDQYQIASDANADNPDLIGVYSWRTLGLNLLPVVPIIRDPKVDGYSKKLTYLPKNVLVFGQNLANDPHVNVEIYNASTGNVSDYSDYLVGDKNHEVGRTEGYSATYVDPDTGDEAFVNKPLYLITTNRDYGVLSPTISNAFDVKVSSNASGLHTHAGDQTDFKSTGEDSGNILGPSGIHTHNVKYIASINLKSKWLNAWVTLKDHTPIANGIILAFAPLKQPSFSKPSDHTNWLPPYWHFCDGNNGTPDLRGYAIGVNMYASQNAVFNTVINSSQNLTISVISVEESSGEVDAATSAADGSLVNHQTHSHILGQDIGKGTAIPMPGSHGIDPNRWHTHSVYNTSTFTNPDNTTSTQLTEGTTVSYLPPRVNLAFIMYNSAIP